MEPTDPLDRAKALIVKGDKDAAIQELSLFLNTDFYHEEALLMLGACLQEKGFNGFSAVLTSAAVDARSARGKPFPEALMNLGAAYKAEHKNDTAARIWADALSQETLPRERAKIMTNISGLYINENQPETAIEWCDRALEQDPRNYGAMANRGLACLEMGRWSEGWAGFRATYATGDRPKRNYRDLPNWDGTPGQHVIAWGDQGIGDEIFNASCLNDLGSVCRRVTLDCHPRIENLFRRSFPEMTVHGTRKNLSELDWLHDSDAEATVGLADLPGIFRKQGEWDGKPYLTAAAIDRGTTPPRIGLSWTGGSKRTRTDLRSLPLGALEPILAARPDAQWFSLQYTPDAARQVCELEEKTGIRISHYPGWVECFDYDRTALFITSLDLVITVTTSVHDLAGALGIPNWTLVPSRTGWRYQRDGDTLPWYNSTRLYRQIKDGEWGGIIDVVARDLKEWTT